MSVKKRFNFCDIIIIVAILAVISSFALRKPLESLLETMFFKTNISYTIEIEKDSFDVSELEVGASLYNSMEEFAGTINNIISDDDTATISISTIGYTDKTGNYIGKNMFIAPGLNIDLYTEQGSFFNCIVKKVQTH